MTGVELREWCPYALPACPLSSPLALAKRDADGFRVWAPRAVKSKVHVDMFKVALLYKK